MQNILILTYWSYSDALIQTYTLPYVRIIRNLISASSKIYIVTLEKDDTQSQDEIRGTLKNENLEWIPIRYVRFGLKAFFLWTKEGYKLIRLIKKQKIEIIHCWCTPPGAIGYVLSLITKRKLVLDSYEPHAEAMVENGTWSKNGLAFRLLFWLEKRQTIRASVIISTTQGMRVYAKEKYNVMIKDFHVKPACVDLKLFSIDKSKNPEILKELGLTNKIVCVYAGKFGGIYLEREVFDFLAVAASYWGDVFKVLLLTNVSEEEIKKNCKQSNLDPNIVMSRYVPHGEVAIYLGAGDFALTPVKPVPSKKFCTPIKDGEYWALGLPVVIPANISDDSEIIELNNIGAVLYEFNHDAYFAAIKKISALLKDPALKTRIRSVAENHRNFKSAEKVYKTIYHG